MAFLRIWHASIQKHALSTYICTYYFSDVQSVIEEKHSNHILRKMKSISFIFFLLKSYRSEMFIAFHKEVFSVRCNTDMTVQYLKIPVLRS